MVEFFSAEGSNRRLVIEFGIRVAREADEVSFRPEQERVDEPLILCRRELRLGMVGVYSILVSAFRSWLAKTCFGTAQGRTAGLSRTAGGLGISNELGSAVDVISNSAEAAVGISAGLGLVTAGLKASGGAGINTDRLCLSNWLGLDGGSLGASSVDDFATDETVVSRRLAF